MDQALSTAQHVDSPKYLSWGAATATKYAAQRIKPIGSIILTNGIVRLRPQKGWGVAAGIGGALEAVTRALANRTG